MEFKEEARGNISLSMLDTKDVFIVDAGSEGLYFIVYVTKYKIIQIKY